MMIEKEAIAPSLIAADMGMLREALAAVEAAGVQRVHLDVMDGHFVPNITFGAGTIAALRPHSRLLFDVHLMVVAPMQLIDAYIDAGSDIVTFHIEADGDVQELLAHIRQRGCRAGLAVNPPTALGRVSDYLLSLDQLIIMGVMPGFSGQSFLPSVFDKLAAAAALVKGSDVVLEVDGGVCGDNVAALRQHGADIFVAGKGIFSGGLATIEDHLRLLCC